MFFTSPWMANVCNVCPLASSPSSLNAVIALTDPPIPPLAPAERDMLTPRSSSHTSPSFCVSLTTPEPGTHPSSRATSRYLFSASKPLSAYTFPALLHASHLARPVKSNSDGREFSGAGATVRYLYNPYSCRCATPFWSERTLPDNEPARPQVLWRLTPLLATRRMRGTLPPRRGPAMAYISWLDDQR